MKLKAVGSFNEKQLNTDQTWFYLEIDTSNQLTTVNWGQLGFGSEKVALKGDVRIRMRCLNFVLANTMCAYVDCDGEQKCCDFAH